MEALQLKGKTLMVIGAHPDDNDFSAGGTVAKAASLGCPVIYVVATRGDRGGSAPGLTGKKLQKMREQEQKEACLVLGVSQVEFLNYEDGKVEATIALKEDIVRLLRRYRPDVVLTMDPAFMYTSEGNFVNHNDHRKVGEAAMDAVYPLARDRLSFPEHEQEGLFPHAVRELCFSASFNPQKANAYCDITETFDRKLEAIRKHVSQTAKWSDIQKRMEERSVELGKRAGCRMAEMFIRLTLDPL